MWVSCYSTTRSLCQLQCFTSLTCVTEKLLIKLVRCGRCSIQRTQEQQLMAMNSKSSVPMASLNRLEVPQPDVTPACKAMIGCCQARTVWMSVKVGILQRLARLQTSSKSSDSAATSLEVFTVSVTLGLCICWRVTSSCCQTIKILRRLAVLQENETALEPSISQL